MRRKILLAIVVIVVGIFINGGIIMAQTEEIIEHTREEEEKGRVIWEKLQAKEIACADISEDEFGSLGEYYMGQMAGQSHAEMNAMMIRMHGEEGERQIHIVMGKRLSGCDTSANLPSGTSWMPMMNMMMGGWSTPFGFGNSMMNFGSFGGGFGGIFMILWWILIIVGIVFLVRWLARTSAGSSRTYEKSALDLLKERYAKGEIDKKEFEERKKDLV